jgi:NADH-quinone oxidoreductase subunit G
MPFGTVSGAGVIFGVTGGVTEAVLRRVVANKSRNELLNIANIGQRGNKGVKEFAITYGDKELKIVVVSGLANAESVIKRMKAGEHFDFIEVMACPGGCVNGGGQPFGHSEDKNNRAKALYEVDKLLPIRRAEENPIINALYEDVLDGRTHELLHVHYGKKH